MNSLSFQVLGLKLPNVLGRAEKLTFQFSYGTKETSYGLSFFKPQPGNFERKYAVKPNGRIVFISDGSGNTDAASRCTYRFGKSHVTKTVLWLCPNSPTNHYVERSSFSSAVRSTHSKPSALEISIDNH